MAVPIIPILKKVGAAVMSNKKGRKTVLYIILTITIIVMLPAIAVMGIFSNDVRIDTSEIESIMQEREKIEAERHAERERVMTDAGLDNSQVNRHKKENKVDKKVKFFWGGQAQQLIRISCCAWLKIFARTDWA